MSAHGEEIAVRCCIAACNARRESSQFRHDPQPRRNRQRDPSVLDGGRKHVPAQRVRIGVDFGIAPEGPLLRDEAASYSSFATLCRLITRMQKWTSNRDVPPISAGRRAVVILRPIIRPSRSSVAT